MLVFVLGGFGLIFVILDSVQLKDHRSSGEETPVIAEPSFSPRSLLVLDDTRTVLQDIIKNYY